MKKKYIVNLSDSQRQVLTDCIEKGKTTAYKIRHAHILLKNALKPHLREQWVIPPGEDAAFVASMEHVLACYQRPLNAEFPVVNMDEQPVQLKADVRDCHSMRPGQVERVDSEVSTQGCGIAFSLH